MYSHNQHSKQHTNKVNQPSDQLIFIQEQPSEGILVEADQQNARVDFQFIQEQPWTIPVTTSGIDRVQFVAHQPKLKKRINKKN